MPSRPAGWCWPRRGPTPRWPWSPTARPGAASSGPCPRAPREEGETVTETALREVREETGLEAELIGPLDTIDYWFVWAPERTRYHKFVHYFLMRFVGGDFSQHDHEMEDAAWFEPDEARRRMSFANERKLLDLIPDVLATQDAGGS